MTHSEVLTHFPDQRRGKARCPAHEDRQASLQVSEGADGRTLIHCHAGCATDAVLRAVGLTPGDLFRESSKAQRQATTGERRIKATYDYRAADGMLLYQVVRYEPKDFRQRRPDGEGGWTWSLQGVDRVLYRLPDLKGQAAVAITEGEHDVDVLVALGVPATCGCGGASKNPDPAKSKWLPAYTAQLKAAGVTRLNIFRDDDEPGLAHATAVARACTAAGLDARLVELPDLPAVKGADVSDWLAAGHTVEELRAAIDNAPTFGAETPAGSDGFRNDATERTVLGDVLAHPAQLGIYRGTGFEAGLFQHPAHPPTWQAIEALDARGIPPTHDAVLSHLRTTGKLGTHGLTAAYVASLQADQQPQETVEKLHADLTSLVLCRDVETQYARDLKALRRDPSTIANGFLDTSIERLESLRARRPNDPTSALLTDVTILAQPTAPMLVRGLLQTNSLGMVCGPSGSGKSHFMNAAAMAVTLGAPLFGRFEVDAPGHVLFIVGEGLHGIPARIVAAKMVHDCPPDHELGILFHIEPFSLLSEEDVSGVLRRVPSHADVKLVVIDTWGRAIIPGDENTQKDAGAGIAAMDRVRRATGACVVAMHHVNATGDRERGSTALRAAVDTVIRIVPVKDGIRRVLCDKARDAAPFDPWHFRLEALGPSCVPMLVDLPHDEPDDMQAAGEGIPEVMLDHARSVLKNFPQISMTSLAKRLNGRYSVCRDAARQAMAERRSK